MFRVLDDSAYDRNDLFNALEQQGTLASIRTRVGTATSLTGSPYRAECVRDWIRWGKISDAMESRRDLLQHRTDLQRRSSSKVPEEMFREILMKVNGYNMLMAVVV